MKRILVLFLLLVLTVPALAQQPQGGTFKEMFKEPLFWGSVAAIAADHITSTRIDGVKFREAGVLATKDGKYNQKVAIPLSVVSGLLNFIIYRKSKKAGRIGFGITIGIRGFAAGNNYVRMY